MNCDTTSTVLRQVSRGAWSHVTDGQSRSCLTSPDVTKRAHAVATTVTPFTPLILTRCLVSPRSRRTLLVAVLGMAGAGLVALGWWRDSSPALERFPVWGLDVSHHQGVIDWARVTEDRRLRFVFIKATEGGDFRDRRFAENWAAAKRAGLRVGAYHFFTFCTAPELQAQNFLAVVPRDRQAPHSLPHQPGGLGVRAGGRPAPPTLGSEPRARAHRAPLALLAARQSGTGRRHHRPRRPERLCRRRGGP